jgi:hypothetical protein
MPEVPAAGGLSGWRGGAAHSGHSGGPLKTRPSVEEQHSDHDDREHRQGYRAANAETIHES